VQVLEDDDNWLLEALAQHDPLERFQRAPALYLRVHMGDWVGILGNSEQGEAVGLRL
jgi:hypothetical protein